MPETTIKRRTALAGIATAAAALALPLAAPRLVRAQGAGPITVPPLPYAESALAPVISARTVGLHYGKHHKGYADTVNKALAGPARDLAGLPLEEIVTATRGKPERTALFNAAAQVWNHDFYWRSLAPRGQPPAGRLRDEIAKAFGDVAGCKKALAEKAVTQFGSGWAWLSWDPARKTLLVEQTANAETPLGQGRTPLLTVDVWEHAYYLDYENRRAQHVEAVLDKLLNWEFAARNLG